MLANETVIPLVMFIHAVSKLASIVWLENSTYKTFNQQRNHEAFHYQPLVDLGRMQRFTTDVEEKINRKDGDKWKKYYVGL